MEETRDREVAAVMMASKHFMFSSELNLPLSNEWEGEVKEESDLEGAAFQGPSL